MDLPVAQSVVAAPQLPADTAGDQTPLLPSRERHQQRTLCSFVQITLAERAWFVATEAGSAHCSLFDRLAARFFVDTLIGSTQNPKSRLPSWWGLWSLERTMYVLVSQLKSRAALITEAVCFSIALVTAEV